MITPEQEKKIKSIDTEENGNLQAFFKTLRLMFRSTELIEIFEVSSVTFYKFSKGIEKGVLNSKIMTRTLFDLLLMAKITAIGKDD